MPTGYTAKLSEGDQSVEDFLKGLARGMGFLVTMRDDPWDAEIPDKIEPSDYHKEQLEAAQNRLAGLHSMSDEDMEREAQIAYDCEQTNYYDRLTEKRETKLRYENMTAKMLLWSPTHEAMRGLKRFALEQIETSMSDCSTRWMEKPVKLSVEEWREKAFADIARDLDYHTKEYAKECARAAERTEALRELRKEIAKLTPTPTQEA